MKRISQQVFDGIIALEKAGPRGQVKVMVGGAPLNDEFARQIGADGYSQDASRAVTLAKSLVAWTIAPVTPDGRPGQPMKEVMKKTTS